MSKIKKVEKLTWKHDEYVIIDWYVNGHGFHFDTLCKTEITEQEFNSLPKTQAEAVKVEVEKQKLSQEILTTLTEYDWIW